MIGIEHEWIDEESNNENEIILFVPESHHYQKDKGNEYDRRLMEDSADTRCQNDVLILIEGRHGKSIRYELRAERQNED
jgi:hypothetical protein